MLDESVKDSSGRDTNLQNATDSGRDTVEIAGTEVNTNVSDTSDKTCSQQESKVSHKEDSLADVMAEVSKENSKKQSPGQSFVKDSVKDSSVKDTVGDKKTTVANAPKNVDSSVRDPRVTDLKDAIKSVALSHWTQEEKDFFNSLTLENQNRMLRMYKGMEKVYQNKTLALNKEYEPTLKEHESINNALKPYEADLARLNMSKADAISDVMESIRHASEDPVNYIIELMTIKGITPDVLAEKIENYQKRQSDPVYTQINPLKQQVSSLQQKINEQEEYRRQIEDKSKMAAAQSQLEDFKRQTDENGALKYPYFDAVKEQMAMLYKNGQYNGLEDLYNEAVWLNPQIRNTLISSEREKALQSQKEEVVKTKGMQAASLASKKSPRDSKIKGGETLSEILRDLSGRRDDD